MNYITGAIGGLVQNSLTGMVTGAVAKGGEYAGDLVNGGGEMIANYGAGVGKGVAGYIDGYGNWVRSYGDGIIAATAPNAGGGAKKAVSAASAPGKAKVGDKKALPPATSTKQKALAGPGVKKDDASKKPDASKKASAGAAPAKKPLPPGKATISAASRPKPAGFTAGGAKPKAEPYKAPESVKRSTPATKPSTGGAGSTPGAKAMPPPGNMKYQAGKLEQAKGETGKGAGGYGSGSAKTAVNAASKPGYKAGGASSYKPAGSVAGGEKPKYPGTGAVGKPSYPGTGSAQKGGDILGVGYSGEKKAGNTAGAPGYKSGADSYKPEYQPGGEKSFF